MAQYKRAMEAVYLPFHFLIMIFVDALVHMGWSPYNPALGFKIPEVSSGTKGMAGFFPHWCQSLSTYSMCWFNFLAMLDSHGGHPAMRAAMSNLQFSISAMVASSEDAEYGWSVAAHLIIARVHAFCTSLDVAALGAPLSMEEERNASARARIVKKPTQPRTNSQSFLRGGFNGGGHQSKRPRNSGSFNTNNNNNTRNNNNRGNQGSCPFHPGASHPVETCTKFLALAKNVNSNASERSG